MFGTQPVSPDCETETRAHGSSTDAEALARSRHLEIYCYALSPDDQSAARRIVQQSCTVFRDVSALRNLEVRDNESPFPGERH